MFFYEACLQVPDFSCRWDLNYREQFGINFSLFSNYKKDLAKASSSAQREQIEESIIDYVKAHKENELWEIAREEARARGGHLIYRHFDRQYGTSPEPIRRSRSFSFNSSALKNTHHFFGKKRPLDLKKSNNVDTQGSDRKRRKIETSHRADDVDSVKQGTYSH